MVTFCKYCRKVLSRCPNLESCRCGYCSANAGTPRSSLFGRCSTGQRAVALSHGCRAFHRRASCHPPRAGAPIFRLMRTQSKLPHANCIETQLKAQHRNAIVAVISRSAAPRGQNFSCADEDGLFQQNWPIAAVRQQPSSSQRSAPRRRLLYRRSLRCPVRGAGR